MKAKKRKKVTKVTPPNMLFPGRPNYKGPQRGWFGHIHHGKLAEEASEPISNRVTYIRQMKPADEKRIRLQHLIYLGKYLGRLCSQTGDVKLRQGEHTELRAKVMAYCKKHIRPYRWDEGVCNLRKADGRGMTG